MSETLAWTTYSDAGALELELRRIFARGWQYAGHTGQVERPGDRFAVRAGHVPVAVVHGEDGEVRAFVNACRHRGAEVVRESGNRKTLQCHYHAWTYGLDGSLLTAPRSERGESRRRPRRLPSLLIAVLDRVALLSRCQLLRRCLAPS